ncbi:MAG: hypothetical protein ACR2M3_14410 [Thermomicrobiales bacterium]
MKTSTLDDFLAEEMEDPEYGLLGRHLMRFRVRLLVKRPEKVIVVRRRPGFGRKSACVVHVGEQDRGAVVLVTVNTTSTSSISSA